METLVNTIASRDAPSKAGGFAGQAQAPGGHAEAPGGLVGAPYTATDMELLVAARSMAPHDERRSRICEILVERHQGLVRSCVNRYRRSPEPTEDLMQVGYVGLMKAINNFDPTCGHSLAAYAQPCVNGELKRYFRDKRWQVHIERPVQERLLELRKVARELTQQDGHEPSDGDLAGRLECTEAEVREARRAELMMLPSSLDTPIGDGDDAVVLADALGAEDPAVEHLLSMQALSAHWGELPEREQRILLMRFYGEMTQAEIGRALGISQMHVSRLLAHALGFLRERLADQSPAGHRVA